VNEHIKVLGNTIKELKSRQYETAVQRAERIFALERKMNDLIRKLISLEDDLITLQTLSDSKQSQRKTHTHKN
jgi:hypothetical protein